MWSYPQFKIVCLDEKLLSDEWEFDGMIKRGFDIIFSFIGLIVILPFLVIVAVAIIINDGRPIFFKQQRIGKKGKPFKIWKFRTMSADNYGPSITVHGDQRITNLGRILRRYKLDELPQLVNVLVGEMSIVGPRPEVRKYVDLYSEEQKSVLNVRPGITDYASIKYFDENVKLSRSVDPEKTYIEEILPDKLAINRYYIENQSLMLDFDIIIKTLLSIKGKNSEDGFE